MLIGMLQKFATNFTEAHASSICNSKLSELKNIYESLKLLSIVAAIRLDEKQDSIENILISRLLERTTAVSSQNRDVGDSGDPLASSSWEEVSPENTLLAPVQCKSLWRQFMTETEYTVSQAISAQVWTFLMRDFFSPSGSTPAKQQLVTSSLGNSGYDYTWFQQIHASSKESTVPLHSICSIFIGESSVDTDRHSWGVPKWHSCWIYSVSSRFLPNVMDLLRQLAAEAQGNPAPEASRTSRHLASQSFRNQVGRPNPVSSSVSSSSVSSSISTENESDTRPLN